MRDCGGAQVSCDHLVVATGNNVFPVAPYRAAVAVAAAIAAAVEAVQPRDYRQAEPFRGKAMVIVGGGQTASDSTLEIASVARRTWVSLHSGPGWVVPRMRGDLAADILTHRGFWSLPCTFGGRRLVTADGQRIEGAIGALARNLNGRCLLPTAQSGMVRPGPVQIRHLQKADRHAGRLRQRQLEQDLDRQTN